MKTAIYDRYGKIIDEFSQQAAVSLMSWDKDGDVLATATGQNSTVVFWDVGTKKTETVDMNPGGKDILTFLAWSPSAPVLAIGNSKGSLILYNRQTAKKVQIVGKHQQAITCGAFSNHGHLGLGSDDGTITINTDAGDIVHTISCCSDPTMLKFYNFKRLNEKGINSDITLSVVLGGTILMVLDMSDLKKPINLQFQSRYGDIVSYAWYGNGYILIGFSFGFFVCISAHTSEIGQEMFSVQDFKNYLGSLYVSEALSRVLIVGDNQLKLRDVNQLSELLGMYDIEDEEKRLGQVQASDDGQLVAISGISGTLHVFLTKMPVVGAAYRSTIAILSSLTEVTVITESKKTPVTKATVPVEPTAIAIGPRHFAVTMNNRAWLYEISICAEMVCELQYISSINLLLLNEKYAAAKLDGVAQLHKLRDERGHYNSDVTGKIFPDPQHCNARIQDIAMTSDFFIYCSDAGHLNYYSFDYETHVNEYKHSVGIRRIFPDHNSVRLCFFDDRFDAFVYSPVDDSLYKIPTVESAAHFDYCMWENANVDKNVFVICYKNIFHAFLFSPDQVNGQFIMSIGTSTIPYGFKPLMLCKGVVHCQSQNGRASTALIEPLKADVLVDGKAANGVVKQLDQAILLKRWALAWKICQRTALKEDWQKFGRAVLQNAEIELAMQIYKQMGDVAMVWALEELQEIEERTLLLGHIAMILQHFDAAEEFFLKSSHPIHALNMRRDCLHWDKALQLASQLDPKQIPFISKEYAQQLEFTGRYSAALEHYEKAVIDAQEEDNEKIAEHNEACNAGIARMCVRGGDISRGMAVAGTLIDKTAVRDCASILEEMKQFIDAGQLYELCQFYSRAASAYLKAKNWTKVASLLPKVRSPKIHSQYAKVMEEDKKYKQAALAYKNARDYDNLVRVLLDHLKMPNEAIVIVKENKSIEGARLIANFFMKVGDQKSAVEFLVMSQCYQEAFQLAESAHQMGVYAEAIEENGTQDQFAQVAQYFAEVKDVKSAGKYYYKAGNYWKALDNFVFNGEDLEAMNIAIDCTVESQDPQLSQRLIEFLMGDLDGIPKDPKLIFRYYVAKEMKQEASTTAVVIAQDVQNRGTYRQAHQCLFSMHQELVHKRIQVPSEMANTLMLLHSYLIVKGLIKRDEHMKAARMLVRVANNISKFPQNEIAILTAAAIECAKVGLKRSAFKYAAQIIKPEKRKRIDEKYQRKIETIVRKMDKAAEDVEEPNSPCPFCAKDIPETELVCNHCKNLIPYCILTGRHVVRNDFSTCPNCEFPGYYSEFKKLLSLGDKCPMCSSPLDELRLSDAGKFFSQERDRVRFEENGTSEDGEEL